MICTNISKLSWQGETYILLDQIVLNIDIELWIPSVGFIIDNVHFDWTMSLSAFVLSFAASFWLDSVMVGQDGEHSMSQTVQEL